MKSYPYSLTQCLAEHNYEREKEDREKLEKDDVSLSFGLEERQRRKTKFCGIIAYFVSLKKCKEREWRSCLYILFRTFPASPVITLLGVIHGSDGQ